MMHFNKKNYSFRKRLNQITSFLLLLQLLVFLLYSVFFTISIRNRAYEEIRQIFELYNAEISENLRSVDYYLVEINNYNSDISMLGATTDAQGSYVNIANIYRLFDYNLRSFPNIDGLFAYFPNSDTWIADKKSSFLNNDFVSYLREDLSHINYNDNDVKSTSTNWILYSYEGKSYFVNYFLLNNSIVGAWTDTDQLSSALVELLEKDGSIFFVAQNGTVLPTGADNSLTQISVKETLDHYSIVKQNGLKYLTVSASLDYCDYYITAMLPLRQVDVSSDTVIRVLLVFIVVTFVSYMFVRHLFEHFLAISITKLESVTDSISNGNMESRIQTTDVYCLETLHISESYNHMIDTIQELKIHVYEEKLQSKNLELLYLKAQIAPHFLINCLNMISYLADGKPDHTQLIRNMIATLSTHLRYTLSATDRVTLAQELTYEKNYIDLTMLRFPNCISFSMDIEESAKEAIVFPLILIMITENTFKHNLVMGEPLQIKLQVYLTQTDNTKRLHLIHIDSGSGYPPEILKYYNSYDIQSSDPIAPNDACSGTHIGIQNLHKRLALYYNDTVHLILSNEPGMGARTEIDIPYVTHFSSDTSI